MKSILLIFSSLVLLLSSELIAQQLAPAGNTVALLDRAKKEHLDGNFDEARRLYEQVVPRLRSEGDRKRLGGALYLVSLVYRELGEYLKALESAQESARMRVGEKPGEADSINGVGLALLALGSYDEALNQFSRALDLYRTWQMPEDEVIALNNAGNAYYFQGKYLDALDRYQAAMRLVEQTSKEAWAPHERQHTTANLAVLFQKLGRYDLALDLYAPLRSTPGVLLPSENVRVLTNLGTLYRHLGDPVKALETYGAALKFFISQKNYDGQMGVLKTIGIAQALDLGRFADALTSFQEVLKLAAQTANRREAVQAHLYSGETLRRLSRLEEAGREFEAALDGARSLGIVEEQWETLDGLGRIARESGDPQEALKRFEEAISLIESIRSRIRLSSLRGEFLADKRDVYDAAIELLLKQAGPEAGNGRVDQEALEQIHRTMEHARARTFRDQLYDSLESFEAQNSPDLTHRLRELRAQMSLIWTRQLRSGPERSGQLRAEYASLEEKYADTERKLAANSKNRAGDADLSVRDIQSRLAADTMMVEVWMGGQTLALVWISRSDAGLARHGFQPADMQKIVDCRNRVSRAPSAEDWRAVCAPLSNIVFGDLPAQVASYKNLVFVQDEKLAALPFEVLSLPGMNEPLVGRFNVSYLPAASMVPLQPAPGYHAMPWAKTLLAFGDPVIPQPDEGAGPYTLDSRLAPLAHSKDEVESISARISGRKSLHIGPDALKRYLFQEESKGFRLLHFSTHATADSESPQRSRIMFSPGLPLGPADYLFLGEILNLDLRGTELVTLSACDTAVGRVIRGEGPQDFSRAFLMAGAQATVASLWRVSDEATAEFMKQFYFYLGQGHSKAESLREAKLRFLHEQGPLSHPYYWAAFALNGDGASSVTRPIPWTAFLAFSAALLVVLILFLVKTFSRQPR